MWPAASDLPSPEFIPLENGGSVISLVGLMLDTMYLKEPGTWMPAIQCYYHYHGYAHRNWCQQGGTKYGESRGRSGDLVCLRV